MSAVRSKNTEPEMLVRRMLHAQGYRYRIHRSDLPGSPDLAFPSRRKVIFVNGCLWHGHDCERGKKVPRTDDSYWFPKISRNVERDAENLEKLAALGWNAMVAWECEIRDDLDRLGRRIMRFLE